MERVDYRNDTLILRDYFTERTVRIDLRRGDYVKFAGDWNTWSGIFYAYQIEELRSRRR